MKTVKTILNIAIATLVVASANTAMAQDGGVKLEGTSAIAPNAGNALERELTPALREQGRKKVILENKKLDLEIEKIDLDILKVQQESLNLTNPMASMGGVNGSPALPNLGAMGGIGGVMGNAPKIIDASGLSNTPMSLPKISDREASAPVKLNLSGEASDGSDGGIRVLMILTGRSNNDLRAKIMHKRQGGYVVGAGDVLPNGKKVLAVTEQYIEVAPPNSKKKSERTKIYVSGYPTEAEDRMMSNMGMAGLQPPQDSSSTASSSRPVTSPFGLPLANVPTVTRISPPAGQIR